MLLFLNPIGFKKSSKRYCVQGNKIVKSKNVVKKSKLTHGNQFPPIVQVLFFKWRVLKNKIRGTTGVELVHISCFEGFRLNWIFLALFCLCWCWTCIFVAWNLVLIKSTAIFSGKFAITPVTRIYAEKRN